MTTENQTQVLPPVDVNNPKHYVNNVKFYDALVAYRKACAEAESAGKERPIIPNYIGECILKIAQGLAKNYNFRNYSYIQDMISQGVEFCCRYILSFDPAKSNNPFAYFTQTCYRAFILIIQKEHKQARLKKEALFNGGFDTFDIDAHDLDEDFKVDVREFLMSLDMKPEKKKERVAKPGALDAFFGDGTE